MHSSGHPHRLLCALYYLILDEAANMEAHIAITMPRWYVPIADVVVTLDAATAWARWWRRPA